SCKSKPQCFGNPVSSRSKIEELIMNNLIKNMAIWLVIALVLMTVFNQFSTRQPSQPPMEYSQFISEMHQGRIAKVVIDGRTLRGSKTDGRQFIVHSPSDPWLVSDLLKA